MRLLQSLSALSLLSLAACASPSFGATDGDPETVDPGEKQIADGNGVAKDTEPTEDFVVTHVSLYQAVEILLYPTKAELPTPIIANKDALVRVLVRPASGKAKVQKVFAIAQLDDDGKTFAQGAPTAIADTEETIVDIKVSAAQLETGAKLRVRLMPEGASATSRGSVGTWPTGGASEDLAPEVSGEVHLVYVPVTIAKSKKFGTPNLTPELLAAMKEYLLAIYPLGRDRLTIDLHAPYVSQITPNEDTAGAVLSEMFKLHTADRAGNEVRYIGFFDFDADQFAIDIDTTKPSWNAGGIANRPSADAVMSHTTTHPVIAARIQYRGAPLTEPDPWGKTQSSIEQIAGYSKCPAEDAKAFLTVKPIIDGSFLTVAHEVGHSYSLPHVSSTDYPFSAKERDPSFPREDGKLGADGYDARSNAIFRGDGCLTDMMAYGRMSWISDHNYRRLTTLIRGNP